MGLVFGSVAPRRCGFLATVAWIYAKCIGLVNVLVTAYRFSVENKKKYSCFGLVF
jgi:hypothetical protein